MKRVLRFFAVIVLLSGGVAANARADGLIDTVRAGLQAEDFAALEAVLGAAHQDALAQRDFSALRTLYSILFVTAHKERLARLEAWHTTYPASPYAAGALAWSHIHRAYLLRGTGSSGTTAPEAQQAFYEELMLGKSMADAALENAPDFLPAVDAAIELRRTHVDDGPVWPLVERALDVAPDRHAMLRAFGALNVDWGHDLNESLKLCADLSDKVPGYDTELCLIDVVFENRLRGEIRKAAVEVLETRDEPFLDDIRLNVYLNEWQGRAEAAEQAKRLHKATLGPQVNIEIYQSRLQRLVAVFDLPFYGIEAQDALVATLAERVADNPQNYRVRRVLAEEELLLLRRSDPDASIARAAAHWREMLALGAYQSATWELGAAIEGTRHSRFAVDRLMPYYTNQIYYANHDPWVLREVVVALFTNWMVANGELASEDKRLDKAALNDAVLCPMFRTGRIYQAICEAYPGQQACQVGGWASDFPDRIRRLMRDATACEWERTAAVEDLLFVPVPVEAFLREETQ